jgi:STE24 endopeptidase
MLTIIATIYFFYLLAKLCISCAEIGYVARTRAMRAVVLGEEEYQKAADYKIANEKFAALGSLWDYALFLMWVLWGLRALEALIITDGGVWQNTLFVLAFLGVNFILSLPFDIYSTFVKERKFGFSTITPAIYALDTLKSVVIFLLVGAALGSLIVYLIANFALWWLWAFAAVFVLVLFINMIYPTLIAPIFNKFTPLDEGELKQGIETLMERAGLRSSGVFTMDASKRDNRLNAYFGGLGRSKRVVLFDTLVEKLERSELLAVLGHELGHFKHKDILKNIALSGALLLFIFAFFGNLPASVYDAVGLQGGAGGVIVIFLLLSPILSFLLMPIVGALSRKHEYAADRYGSECESAEALISALEKLATENKSFPRSHPLYIAFYFSHPPLLQRLEALGKRYDEAAQ